MGNKLLEVEYLTQENVNKQPSSINVLSNIYQFIFDQRNQLNKILKLGFSLAQTTILLSILTFGCSSSKSKKYDTPKKEHEQKVVVKMSNNKKPVPKKVSDKKNTTKKEEEKSQTIKTEHLEQPIIEEDLEEIKKLDRVIIEENKNFYILEKGKRILKLYGINKDKNGEILSFSTNKYPDHPELSEYKKDFDEISKISTKKESVYIDNIYKRYDDSKGYKIDNLKVDLLNGEIDKEKFLLVRKIVYGESSYYDCYVDLVKIERKEGKTIRKIYSNSPNKCFLSNIIEEENQVDKKIIKKYFFINNKKILWCSEETSLDIKKTGKTVVLLDRNYVYNKIISEKKITKYYPDHPKYQKVFENLPAEYKYLEEEEIKFDGKNKVSVTVFMDSTEKEYNGKKIKELPNKLVLKEIAYKNDQIEKKMEVKCKKEYGNYYVYKKCQRFRSSYRRKNKMYNENKSVFTYKNKNWYPVSFKYNDNNFTLYLFSAKPDNKELELERITKYNINLTDKIRKVSVTGTIYLKILPELEKGLYEYPLYRILLKMLDSPKDLVPVYGKYCKQTVKCVGYELNSKQDLLTVKYVYNDLGDDHRFMSYTYYQGKCIQFVSSKRNEELLKKYNRLGELISTNKIYYSNEKGEKTTYFYDKNDKFLKKIIRKEISFGVGHTIEQICEYDNEASNKLVSLKCIYSGNGKQYELKTYRNTSTREYFLYSKDEVYRINGKEHKIDRTRIPDVLVYVKDITQKYCEEVVKRLGSVKTLNFILKSQIKGILSRTIEKLLDKNVLEKANTIGEIVQSLDETSELVWKLIENFASNPYKLDKRIDKEYKNLPFGVSAILSKQEMKNIFFELYQKRVSFKQIMINKVIFPLCETQHCTPQKGNQLAKIVNKFSQKYKQEKILKRRRNAIFDYQLLGKKAYKSLSHQTKTPDILRIKLMNLRNKISKKNR